MVSFGRFAEALNDFLSRLLIRLSLPFNLLVMISNCTMIGAILKAAMIPELPLYRVTA